MVEVIVNDESVELTLRDGSHLLVYPSGSVVEWDDGYNLVGRIRSGEPQDRSGGAMGGALVRRTPMKRVSAHPNPFMGEA